MLTGLATGIAAATLTRDGFAAQPAAPTPLKLGLVTYNWGKDWDIEELIRNCSLAQFTGVELRSTHRHGVEISLSPAEREEVRKRFADSDVELMGLGSACEYHAADPAVVRKNVAETKEFIHLCHDVGASGVKVRPNGLPRGVPIEKTLHQIGKALNEVAAYGADYGVQIRLEVHGQGTAELPNIKTIMDVADHPGNVVCWNCNPQDLQGEGFDHNYDLVKDRMGTVHIHDLRKANYPWQALFDRLKVCDAPGFTGWTLIEEGAIPADIPAAMQENRLIWEQLSKV
ncbi:MAG: sugar phosphate isomerase/epimerase [Planctomycetaceae bacterium]|nr:MAG: sugar phosphate isomerase/epimerase [Planctomycetaceae bacterium]